MKKKELEHDKNENNLTITPKSKTWNSSHAKRHNALAWKNPLIDIKLHDLNY